MAKVHCLAVVDPRAELGADVEIGPFCVVEAGVQIGEGTALESHAVIKAGTTLGKRNHVGQGVILGGDPQDRKYADEPTFLTIGDNNRFREFVTVHRATGAGNCTVIGNDCFLMAYCHIGHNTTLHDSVTMANACSIAGHVTLEAMVNIGGMTGIHQFVRVGRSAMVGGFTKVVRDVPPFTVFDNEGVRDINAIGLRRLGVNSAARLALHKAVKLLFKSQLGLTNALETVRREVPSTEEVEYLIAFQERVFRGKNGRGDQP